MFNRHSLMKWIGLNETVKWEPNSHLSLFLPFIVFSHSIHWKNALHAITKQNRIFIPSSNGHDFSNTFFQMHIFSAFFFSKHTYRFIFSMWTSCVLFLIQLNQPCGYRTRYIFVVNLIYSSQCELRIRNEMYEVQKRCKLWSKIALTMFDCPCFVGILYVKNVHSLLNRQ